MKAILRLVDSAEIVQLPVREPSTFEDGWNARQGMMKKRGDGKDKTRKLWEKAAKKVGSKTLLEALKRYLRSEKEPTCGYPGLSVWLNGERYDHWLPESSAKAPDGTIRPVCPDPIRSRLVSTVGEPFVRSYVDPCIFHEDEYITPKTDYAKGKLMEKARELKQAGISGIRGR